MRLVKKEVLFAYLALLVACGPQPKVEKYVDEAENVEVQVLDQRESPRFSISVVGSIGSETESNYVFGNISDVAFNGESIAVLDLRFQTISEYDPTSLHFIQRQVIEEGEGPGEMYGPIWFEYEDDGRVHVVSNRSFKICTYVQHENRLTYVDQIRAAGLVRLDVIGEYLHVVHQYRYATGASIVEVYDRNGDVVASYGTQSRRYYEDGEVRKLSGAYNVFLAATERISYMAYSYPMQIRAYNLDDYSLVACYELRVPYEGDTITDKDTGIAYPTGKIVGVQEIDTDTVIAFTIHMRSRSDYTHYANIIDMQSGTFQEMNLSESDLGDLQVYTRSEVLDGHILLATLDPYPCVKILELERNNLHGRNDE